MIYTVNTEDTINWRARGRARIAQNVQNLLCTIKTEVAYKRNKGRNSESIDTDPERFRNLVIAETYEIVEEYEPRAEIISVKVKGIDVKGVYIEVVIKVE